MELGKFIKWFIGKMMMIRVSVVGIEGERIEWICKVLEIELI